MTKNETRVWGVSSTFLIEDLTLNHPATVWNCSHLLSERFGWRLFGQFHPLFQFFVANRNLCMVMYSCLVLALSLIVLAIVCYLKKLSDTSFVYLLLGIEIRRLRWEVLLYLSRSVYVQKLLEKFKIKETKSVSTLLAIHFRLLAEMSPTTNDENKYTECAPYASIINIVNVCHG